MKQTVIKLEVTYRGHVPKGMKTLALQWLRNLPIEIGSSNGIRMSRTKVREIKAKGIK